MDPTIGRALISVSDKQGLDTFARHLDARGIAIYSTGGTRRYLEGCGVPVRDLSQYTGFPEVMDGRVKTLHPKVFAGILCRHDHDEDMQVLHRQQILSFELVVVNLYPFAQAAARPEATEAEVIEQIDIGGPSLVRAAAKNHAFTTIVTSPAQYDEVLAEVQAHGATSLALRRKLAAAAFEHTAQYDRHIADWFARSQPAGEAEPWPESLALRLTRCDLLRYGENPHQSAALYRLDRPAGPNLVEARQLAGKQLSYNNLLDLDSALAAVRDLAAPAAVVIKHNNPCGAAEGDSPVQALRQALAGDPTSAFGGILGLNRTLDADCAALLSEPGQYFIEAIVAPDFEPAAVEILTTRPKWKASVRLLAVGDLHRAPSAEHWRAIEGGFLAQQADVQPDNPDDWQVVTQQRPDEGVLRDLRFAWVMVRHVKSNAIVLAQDGALVGVGAGQMSRVDSVQIALRKAGPRANGSVLASDAFFPFPDSIEQAAAAGVAAVIQPGGSRNDGEVIAACDRHHLPMVFTGRRHFRH